MSQLAAIDPLLLSCRRLFLRDYEVWINIGVHDAEKRAEQRVIINVDLYVPLAVSTPRDDRLDEVLDYDYIRRTVSRQLNHGHVHLQETLCDDLAEQLLAHDKVKAVRVSTTKPNVYPDCAGIGVEVFRSKP